MGSVFWSFGGACHFMASFVMTARHTGHAGDCSTEPHIDPGLDFPSVKHATVRRAGLWWVWFSTEPTFWPLLPLTQFMKRRDLQPVAGQWSGSSKDQSTIVCWLPAKEVDCTTLKTETPNTSGILSHMVLCHHGNLWQRCDGQRPIRHVPALPMCPALELHLKKR